MMLNAAYSAQSDTARQMVYEAVSSVAPLDALEAETLHHVQQWIQSGEPIFRLAKPATPPKHLVSYFVLFDEEASKILLVDHKNALAWLPAGGHVEVNEDPKETVRRECVEELGGIARFWREEPFFITSTVTYGISAGHTDVTLWYVLEGSEQTPYTFDDSEFNSIRWFGLDEIPFERADPHLRRFVEKLRSAR